MGTAPGGYAARRHQPACTFCIADAVPLRAGGCAADGFVRRAQPHGKISDSPHAGLCALCGGDRVFPLLQRVLCAVLPAGCAGGTVRCLRCTLCLAGGHGLYGVLAGYVPGQPEYGGRIVRHAADSGGSAPPRRVESHRPDRSAHGADGRQRRGAVYADFKGVPAAVRCGPVRCERHQRCGAGHAAQSAAGPEKRLL